MKLITERDLIRSVSSRWNEQYKHWPPGDRLAALDLEVVTADEVAGIIGNTSWTHIKCDECGDEDTGAVVQIGQEPDYESCTATICFACLEKALALKPNAKDQGSDQ